MSAFKKKKRSHGKQMSSPSKTDEAYSNVAFFTELEYAIRQREKDGRVNRYNLSELKRIFNSFGPEDAEKIKEGFFARWDRVGLASPQNVHMAYNWIADALGFEVKPERSDLPVEPINFIAGVFRKGDMVKVVPHHDLDGLGSNVHYEVELVKGGQIKVNGRWYDEKYFTLVKRAVPDPSIDQSAGTSDPHFVCKERQLDFEHRIGILEGRNDVLERIKEELQQKLANTLRQLAKNVAIFKFLEKAHPQLSKELDHFGEGWEAGFDSEYHEEKYKAGFEPKKSVLGFKSGVNVGSMVQKEWDRKQGNPEKRI